MSLDLAGLRALVATHGPVVRVVLAEVRGSAPREAGASVSVWADGQAGTIGGGALEHRAVLRARALLAEGGSDETARLSLGPSLGQCCGGAVTLLSARWDAARLAETGDAPVVARGPGQMPLAVRRTLAQLRAGGRPPLPLFAGGWLVERVAQPARALWIHGAGHVGRALVNVLSPLPDLAITWVDTAPDRFPPLPEGVTRLVARQPAEVVRHAPRHAEHLILTYSHDIDLDLCHRLLGHGFGFAGLIGSATKWARFRSRLAQLGHAPETIARITCPIGDPALGKHPQAIAVGVAAALLAPAAPRAAQRDSA